MIEIVLSGPGKNALGTPVMSKALADFKAASGQPVLLRGEGDCFSAGLNLKEIATLEPDGMRSFLELLDELIVAILSHDAPTVAFINGHAIAGGCVLALACDLRVMQDQENLRMGLNEVALGLIFPPRVLSLARARLAPSHLARVILEAGLYGPAEALRLGLVHQVSARAEADAKALLTKLGEHPREAYLEAKREQNSAVATLSPKDMDDFATRVLPKWSSPELKMTVARALMKRS